MHHTNPREKPAHVYDCGPTRRYWLGGVLCVLVILVGYLTSRRNHHPPPQSVLMDPASLSARAEPEAIKSKSQPPPSGPLAQPASTAEQIVAQRLAQFARSRLGFARALARQHNIPLSNEVERFFKAAESGNWEEIEAAFNTLNGGDSSAGHAEGRVPEVAQVWPAIIDAYGAAEQVHLWPAQKLLDYGTAVLAALRPGMVYVGGTDNGRWIPELLNDTSGSERHIIVTQNALADSSYLDYMRLQYDDRLTLLSGEESSRAFADYLADAQKRLEHDHQFPDEPKQLRSGEDVRLTEGKVQVGGQVAVMAINEILLQTLMQKNPGLSFAIQESYPFKGTYADALPLGPLMELGAATDQNGFTAERAAQSLEYWRATAQQVASDPEAASSEAALRSYSHDTVAAAHLLAAHDFGAEAEQAYRLASELWPGNPEPIGGLVDLFVTSGRADEAQQLLNDFARKYPDQREALERTSAATHLLWTSVPPGR